MPGQGKERRVWCEVRLGGGEDHKEQCKLLRSSVFLQWEMGSYLMVLSRIVSQSDLYGEEITLSAT